LRNIQSLTGIRFFAAMHVVLFHNLYLFGEQAHFLPKAAILFIGQGETAVSFFFILSGFILVHVYKNKLETRENKKKYFLARFAKIYPLYVLAFFLDIPRVYSYFISNGDSLTGYLKFGVSSVAYLSMLQSWFPRMTPVWNSPGWSLSCEMFFYLCLPFILKKILNVRKFLSTSLFLYIAPMILFLVITTIYSDIEQNPLFKTFWRSFPLFRIAEFILGALIYNMINLEIGLVKIIKKNTSLVFWGSTMISILIASTPYFEKIYDGRLMAPLFALIIISAYYDDFRGRQIFNNKLLQILGLSSYAIYIIHQPIKPYLLKMSPYLLGEGETYLIGLILISTTLFYCFEIPIQNIIRRKPVH
jgi:peptidoglycan/LPS O-acetylase OafA/YrhL